MENNVEEPKSASCLIDSDFHRTTLGQSERSLHSGQMPHPTHIHPNKSEHISIPSNFYKVLEQKLSYSNAWCHIIQLSFSSYAASCSLWWPTSTCLLCYALTHVTPLFISLHSLPFAACIKFKTLMLAYRTATGSAPSYLHSLMTIYIPFRSLRSAITERHKISLQNVFIHRSWLVDNFQATPENSSLPSSLDYFFILNPPPPKKNTFALFP